MDTAKIIKELRESIGMSRKEFSEHTGIPVRTLEDWEEITSKSFCLELETFVHLKKYFGEKYLKFIRQVWIIILMRKNLFYFFNRCKIKCTGQHINIL